MKYAHPKPKTKLTKAERSALLQEYYDHCRREGIREVGSLKRKVPREAFRELHNRIGLLLLQEAEKLAAESGPIRDFLDANPLPNGMHTLLPDDYRVFALMLNSLKQWIAKESAATDCYLLGAGAREECRALAKCCVLSGITGQVVELHHPVRDGRPPVPLTKEAHAKLEGQTKMVVGSDPVNNKFRAVRKEMNTSWVMIRLGCQALLKRVPEETPRIGQAKSVARRICRETGLSEQQALDWLDENVEG